MRPLVPVWLGLLLAGFGSYAPRFEEVLALPNVEALSTGNDRILVVPLDGPILDEGAGVGIGRGEEGPVARVTRDLRRAAQDPRVKAVVLSVDTPGGGVTPSDRLRREVEAFRRTGRPVVVYAEDLNASGGYYVSTGADWIVSNPTTVTGSIGVIAMYFNVEGLLQKVGVEETTIKSGPHKDMAGLFRKMSPEELAVFQGIVDELYGRFLDVVVRGRPKMTRDQVKALADGRVYTASQALANGLVDQVGYLEDAAAAAAQKAGLPGPVRLVSYERVHQGLVVEILNVRDGSPKPQAGIGMNVEVGGLLGTRTPHFYYLWSPAAR